MTEFDQIIDRRGTGSVKWDKYRDRDILPLWVADMDFRSPPAVIEALHERVSHGIFGYTAPPDELPGVIAEHLRNEFDWEIDVDWLVWLPGLVTGLNVACCAVGQEGDAVATLVPVYPPFLSAPSLTGRQLVTIRLEQTNGRWGIDFDRLEQSITPRTRLFMLCNPHNPVGRAFDRQELERVADLALRFDLIICSDEIHAGLILDQDKRHIPIAALAQEVADRTITLQAPSKTFNIPGLGCSFAVISEPSLRRAFKRAMGMLVPHVNTLGYTATLAAYRYGEEWHRELLAYLRGNRDLVETTIRELPGLSTTHLEATYLAWIDTRETGLTDPGRFFEAAGVGLSDGREFDGNGFVRLNFGCPRPLLQQALQRMRDALAARA
ncbi:MalY/PatB family protein [Geobacter argillaceus]|uniref:cysteine-S-conjugate beta-lyase n=1 Tax=Geobacter argillaceus TaxID=345631 RepID=A0A562V833_9BACT|nr:PatB family C-S lyase [Geobacter argillaceus]TWJ14041.1 cystathionine beta-lyase [Geobacter argillaceus]